jgi:hypothetical protein
MQMFSNDTSENFLSTLATALQNKGFQCYVAFSSKLSAVTPEFLLSNESGSAIETYFELCKLSQDKLPIFSTPSEVEANINKYHQKTVNYDNRVYVLALNLRPDEVLTSVQNKNLYQHIIAIINGKTFINRYKNNQNISADIIYSESNNNCTKKL